MACLLYIFSTTTLVLSLFLDGVFECCFFVYYKSTNQQINYKYTNSIVILSRRDDRVR